jgi:hypothetical protein
VHDVLSIELIYLHSWFIIVFFRFILSGLVRIHLFVFRCEVWMLIGFVLRVIIWIFGLIIIFIFLFYLFFNEIYITVIPISFYYLLHYLFSFWQTLAVFHQWLFFSIPLLHFYLFSLYYWIVHRLGSSIFVMRWRINNRCHRVGVDATRYLFLRSGFNR